MDLDLLRQSLKCKCPNCAVGPLYKSRFSLELRDSCPSCGLDFSRNDSADGPAVFLIFILGAMLVPLAFAFENLLSPPLWVHAALWGSVALGITVGTLRPLKSYIIALQFKHRPRDWDSKG